MTDQDPGEKILSPHKREVIEINLIQEGIGKCIVFCAKELGIYGYETRAL